MEFDLCGAPVQIGIYFGNFQPEIGGGYTYIADLLGAFAELAAGSEHRYVMLCDPFMHPEREVALSDWNVTYIVRVIR